MYARVVSGTMQLDKNAETVEIYRNSIVPAAKEQKGFKGGNLFTDDQTGKFISITLWETEDDMISGDSSGYLQEQLVLRQGSNGVILRRNLLCLQGVTL